MADQTYLALLISTGYISRRFDTSVTPSADEGMGPNNDQGVYQPVMVGDPPAQLSVPCRVAQQSARARFRAKSDEKDVDVSTLTIFTDYRTDVLNRDRFTIDGLEYQTVDVNDPGLMHHHLEFVARRIT
jgi:SPP1 family predicted phage head-tail adaptor